MPYDATLPQSYFDDLYARDPDPWGFETSPYEDGKYRDTIASLPRQSYARALEVGCSIGELTSRLAPLCATLDALDIAEAALAKARARNAAAPHVRFLRMALPDEVPDGPYDLVLLSEVLYYLADDDLERATANLCARLAPGADVLLVHWLGETPDYPSTGDRASEAFIAAAPPSLSIVRQWRRERYRIDLLRAHA